MLRYEDTVILRVVSNVGTHLIMLSLDLAYILLDVGKRIHYVPSTFSFFSMEQLNWYP